jgi:branched-chain amino acid transport system permease protein
MACQSAEACADILLALLLIGLSNGAIIALNALAFTLVYGAVRTINFAHGDLFGLASALVAWALARGIRLLPPLAGFAGPLLVLALIGAVLFGALLNLAIERIAFKPFRSQPRLIPLIATIGVSFVLYQAALVWHVPSTVPALLPPINLVHITRFRLNGRELDYAYRLQDLFVLLLAVGLTALVGRFLQRTSYGRAIRAWSQDPQMALLCGIDGERTIRLVFAIGGGLAGSAAFAFTVFYQHPVGNYGLESGLVAFSAAVLGGIGRPRGAFFGGMLIGVLSAFSDLFLTSEWTPVLILGLLALLLVIRPAGLSGGGMDANDLGRFDEWVIGTRYHGSSRRSRYLALALMIFGLTYPLIDRALGLGDIIAAIGIMFFILLTLGLTIGLGFAGQLNLGTAGWFAFGAYAAALISTSFGGIASNNFTVVVLLSATLAGLLGFGLALLTRRMRGDYLAVVTLAAAQLLQRVLLTAGAWTGGRNGLAVQPRPNLLGIGTSTPLIWYYSLCTVIMLVALGCRRLLYSRHGRAWMALREDELAAISCGIDSIRARSLALTLSSAIAGLAGALYTGVIAYVDPNQADFRISAMVLAMVIIGGAGNILGGVLGAMLIAGVDQLGIPRLGAWLDRLAAAPEWRWVSAIDLRALNLLAFGIVLYLAILLRGRRPSS